MNSFTEGDLIHLPNTSLTGYPVDGVVIEKIHGAGNNRTYDIRSEDGRIVVQNVAASVFDGWVRK